METKKAVALDIPSDVAERVRRQDEYVARRAMEAVVWLPIETAPRDGTYCLFYSPGKKRAGNENAREPYMRIDHFSDEWRVGRHQYPEAPYTHWLPLPKSPSQKETE